MSICLFIYLLSLAQLRNLGPSATKEIELQILWPSHDRRGNPVLEVEGKLQLNGTGSCNVLLITPENATVSVGWNGHGTVQSIMLIYYVFVFVL